MLQFKDLVLPGLAALGALAFVVLAAVWLAGGSEIAPSRQPVRLTVIQAAGLF